MMISVEEALQIVMQTAQIGPIIELPIKKALNKSLAETVYSDRPFPPFNRVCMDGIAINYKAYEEGQRTFRRSSIAPAGCPQAILKNSTECVEIMTGAPLPKGTNTIIRYEDLRQEGDLFTIEQPIKEGSNIHETGSDQSADKALLMPGKSIRSVEINMLATVGKSIVKVYAAPKIAIISSGKELVSIEKNPLPHQIRMSNVHTLHSRLLQMGGDATLFHVPDDKSQILKQIGPLIDQFDAFILSGGVSRGKFDFIPEVFEQLGYARLFYKVQQRPGKPFWFGQKEGKPVFAFPGNPVSALVCFKKYFEPWYNQFIQRTVFKQYAALAEDFNFSPNLTYFALAEIVPQVTNELVVKLHKGNGSGDIITPSFAHGLLELPSHKSHFSKGEIYPFLPFE